ncbi:MAG: segregation/condensation protein A [Spirochaetales bacterium]|nr:segregation/condensation protein A [Spirochaetales bacterium]
MEQVQNQNQYKIGEFEGPLDLLLFLIRKNEVNIYDIPISEIVEQYISYLETGENINLDNITEFYVVAATLLYIKSRMLLPVEIDFDDEMGDPRAELVDKLIEHQKYKKLSEIMAARENDAEWIIERKQGQRPLPFSEDEVWEEIDVWDLLKTFSKILSSMSDERVIDLYEEVSINEKISLINEFLETKKEFMFTELIIRKNSIMDIVCAFLAILECVKMKIIRIFQNKIFSDIRICGVEEQEKDQQASLENEEVKNDE